MYSRPSVAYPSNGLSAGGGPSSSSLHYPSSSSSSSTKTRSLMHLSAQLSLLRDRTAELEHLSRVTSEQASYLRLLGASQAAWFMAAQRVFVPPNEPDQDATAPSPTQSQEPEQ
ncbi:hypothetical protein JCM10212_003278 [Sporobolomyces blumeae]